MFSKQSLQKPQDCTAIKLHLPQVSLCPSKLNLPLLRLESQGLVPAINAWVLTVGKLGWVQTGDRSHTSYFIRDN